jgi:hypothetical protein
VSKLVGSEPACTAGVCTWHARVADRIGCVGYAECGSAKHRKASERVVTCRADEAGRVSDCRAEIVQ